MIVNKRNGKRESVKFDKITARIEKLCYGLDRRFVNSIDVAKKVIEGLYDGVSTTELDNLAAETAASLTVKHPDYALLASRIAVSNLHKNTIKSFSDTMKLLYECTDSKTGKLVPLLADDVWEIIHQHAELLDSTIIYDRDYGFDYFGFKTLEKSYLLKVDGKVVERPQHMYMRVAIGIHKGDIENAIKTYHLMSERWFTHATPTLFNAGTPKPQMSSCFLLTMKDDSIDGIYDTLKQTAKISQSAGGIGLSIHNIRATGSYIGGTNGTSNGIIPMLRVFNDTARYVDQGGGKRKGAFAIYLEPWHADVFAFLDLRKNHGKDELRARDLFYAMWIPDLFMKRVEAGGSWSLFCPHEAPGLADCWGAEFEKLYAQYEAEPGRARKTIKAQDLWFAILDAQTGATVRTVKSVPVPDWVTPELDRTDAFTATALERGGDIEIVWKARRLYREGMSIGTTLQVPPEMWPADRAAFDKYWQESLDKVHIDDTVREFLYPIAVSRVKGVRLPGWLRKPSESFNLLITTGFLPQRFRDEMRLPWDAAKQRRFDRLMALIRTVNSILPKVIREFPFNLMLWDLDRRIKAGRPLV